MTAIFAVAASIQPTRAQTVTDVVWDGGPGDITDQNWRLGLTGLLSLIGINFNLSVDGGKAVVSVVNVNVNSIYRDLSISAGDTLSISNSRSLTLSTAAGIGTVNNAGVLSLSAGANTTSLVISDGTFTFNGSGILSLSNDADNQVRGAASSDLFVNTASHTIQGSGQIGVNSMALSNAGLIKANQSVALIIDPSSSGATNTGTLLATAGATLKLENGSFTNTGGTIQADDDSHIDLTAAIINGGTLTSIDDGHFHILGTSTAFSGVTITAGSNIEIGNAARLNISGAIANSGTIKQLASGSNTELVATAATTLSGNGFITLGSGNTNRIYGSTSTTTLTNAANAISGAGNIGAGQMQLVNQSLIDANLSGSTLTIQLSGTGATNTGTLRASNSGVLTLSGSTVTNTGGTVEAQNGSVVNLSGVTLTNGTLLTSGTGSIRASAGSTLTGLTLSNSATNLRFENGSSNTLGGSITNNGTITINSATSTTDVMAPAGGLTLSGGGVVQLNNNGRLFGATGTTTITNTNNTIRGAGSLGAGQLGVNQLTLVNHGVIEATGTNALTVDVTGTSFTNPGTLRATGAGGLNLSDTTFLNTGTVDIRPGSQVTAAGTFTQSGSAGSLYNNGTITATGFALQQGGLLRGAGTINGTVTNDGTISPGGDAAAAGIGQLIFSNNLSLSSNSVVRIEISGTTAFDQIQASTATLGGSLEVTFANDSQFTIPIGTSFTLLTTTNATGLSGAFAGLTPGSTFVTSDGWGSFQVNYAANSFSLQNFQLVGVPEPSTYALLGLGLAALAALRRRKS